MNPSTRLDVNAYDVYGQADQDLTGLNTARYDQRIYSSLLKISHSVRITGTDLVIQQGHENAADIDATEDVRLSGAFGSHFSDGLGDQVITVKGRVRRFHLSGTITGYGNRGSDIEVGNWYDQRYGMTADGVLDFKRTEGGRVRVALGWVKPFSIKLQGDCEYQVWASLKIKAYYLIKRGVRILLGIKQGQKGPSWL